MNNENMSSGKGRTLVKTTLLPGQERWAVVASLPTNPSCDVTANIPIGSLNLKLQIKAYQLTLFPLKSKCSICIFDQHEIPSHQMFAFVNVCSMQHQLLCAWDSSIDL